MNFFNVEDEFFVIDRYHLDDVKSRFYGYSIQKTGIYDASNINEEQTGQLDGHGCYVYVDVGDDEIKIRQDFNGCYGLYLYNCDGYFAISNSFLRLVEHVKNIKHISLNKDYLNHLIYFPLESDSVSFTPINEIELIDRNAIVYIDKKKYSISVRHVQPVDHKYEIDSEEGMKILDEWFYYWTELFYELNKKTDYLSIDLSGGYDSRLSFLLMLKSGADLNGLRVCSITDGLHTHSEDYEIASQIAREYNFSLNKNLPANDFINYSLEDALNIEIYSKLGFHKEPYIQTRKYKNKIFHVVGGAGEAIRATRFDKQRNEFLNMMSEAASVYPAKLAETLSNSFRKLMEKDFDVIHKKYGTEDNQPYPYGHYILRDTQCRNHFGKIHLVNYFANRITLAPLMDQRLWSLRLSCQEVQDNNFLMALIYQRYCPKLLDFPFEGKRYFLSPETIDSAKRINAKYPLQRGERKWFHDFKVHCSENDFDKLSGQKNSMVKVGEVTSYLKDAFDSSYVKGIFSTEFDEYIYHRARRYFGTTRFFPIRHCYSVLTATKMIESVMESKKSLSEGFFKNHLHQQNARDIYEIMDRYKDNLSARIDIEFVGEKESKILKIDVFDDMARIYQPEFLQKKGEGYVITSYKGELDIYVQTQSDGELNVSLKGMDIRVPGDRSKRIAYWVDYTKFAINNVDALKEVFPSWHNKPYEYSFKVKSMERNYLKVGWRVHQDYFVEHV